MTPHDHTRDDTDDALARAARDAHAASLDHLSPRVQAQLAQRRRAAMQPRRSTAGAWPMIGAASATALALAIGVFVLRDDRTPTSQMADASTPSTTPATTTSTQPSPDTRVADAGTTAPVVDASPEAPVTPAVDAAPDNDDATLPDTLIAAEFDAADAMDAADYGAFDETPDFYAWLGSEDALAEAPESL